MITAGEFIKWLAIILRIPPPPDSGAGLAPTSNDGVVTWEPVGAGSGNVTGPASSVVGDFALWDNTSGTLLRDVTPAQVKTILGITSLSKYVVGVGQSFTSIQAAINQAVTDGATSTNQKTVILTDYSYTENVTCAPGVNIVSIGGNSIIIGNTVFNPSASNQSFASLGVTYKTPASPSGAAFSIAGSNSATLTLINNSYIGTTGTGFECLNANATINGDFNNVTASAGQKAFNITGALKLTFNNNDVQSTDTRSIINCNGEVNFFGGVIVDSFAISGNSIVFIRAEIFEALGTFSAIDIGASAVATVVSTPVQSINTSDYWATGTGKLYFANVLPTLGTAIKIDPGLNSANQQIAEFDDISVANGGFFTGEFFTDLGVIFHRNVDAPSGLGAGFSFGDDTTYDDEYVAGFVRTAAPGIVFFSTFQNLGYLDFAAEGQGTNARKCRLEITNNIRWLFLTDDSLTIQSVPMEMDRNGNVIFGNAVTLNHDPTMALEAATKHYVDSLATGFVFQDACVAATTIDTIATYNNGTAGVGATLTNASIPNRLTIDGVMPNVNDRILVKDQNNPFENGCYTVTVVGDNVSINWVMTRATDYDQAPTEIKPGTVFPINNGGTINGGSSWVETDTVATIGTDPISFTSLSNNPNSPIFNANKLQNNPIDPAAPTDGDVLQFVSGQWSHNPNNDLLYVNVGGTSQAMLAGSRYGANNASTPVAFTLPSTMKRGQRMEIVGIGAAGWTLAQNSGQVIHVTNATGFTDTTVGVSGNLASTTQNARIDILCTIDNTDFIALVRAGNINIT